MQMNRKDVVIRDKFLGIEIDWNTRHTPVGRFRDKTAKDLEWLIEHRFLHPNECYNNAPEVGEFLEFLQENPNFTAQGFADSPLCPYYGITITGVNSSNYTWDDLVAFANFARRAEEFDIDKERLHAWWD